MIDLTNFNTLKVPARAKSFIELTDVEQLKDIYGEILFLGHGANVLFTKDFDGTIVHVNLKGKEIISENDDEIVVEVAAGENWHEFVTWAVENNYSGIENMALIPGTVGAAVVGNIGAYGQEVRNTIVCVRCSVLGIQETKVFNNSECQFGYRDSFFKHHQEYLIIAAQFKLSKKIHLETSYHSRYESLASFLPENPTLKNVYEAIIKIRNQKLPDWNKMGTAGSFFKNPVIPKTMFPKIQKKIPDIKQAYPLPDENFIKLPAGWLLDFLGWKAKKIGNVSTHDKSALVIVNLGGATGKEIYDYAKMMRADVKKNFDIDLEYEVRII